VDVINIPLFGGMIPALEPTMLPATAAAEAVNCWLYAGAVKGLPTPLLVRSPPEGALKSFRFPASYGNPTAYSLLDSWLDFPTIGVDVVRAPVIGDTYDRYYWASDIDVPRYAPRANIDASTSLFILGVPAPGAPTVVCSGGVSATTVTRSYVVTWVSAYGEEGAPSLPVTLTNKVDATWTVTLPSCPGADRGTDRNLTKVRVYRTIVGASGSSEFYRVAELAIDAGTYADTVPDTTVVANGLYLQSLDWLEPPEDLQGFCMMPNGILAGWRENEVHFSHPFRPHAWPSTYTLVVEKQIVGLGVLDQSLVVVTKGAPVIITGVSPDALSQRALPELEPGISRQSIISTPEGVYYAAGSGLMLVSAAGVVNTTRKHVTKDVWRRLTKQSELNAGRFGTAYYCFGSLKQGLFEESAFEGDIFAEQDYGGSYVGFLFDASSPDLGWVNLTTPTPIQSVTTDAWSGDVMFQTDGKIYLIQMDETTNVPQVYKWKSKVFTTRLPVNVAAMKIWFDVPPGVTDYGTVKLYANDHLVMTRKLVKSGEMWRLPAGYKADAYQLEFNAQVQITAAKVITAVKQLPATASSLAQ
jgi:hypothetical protein